MDNTRHYVSHSAISTVLTRQVSLLSESDGVVQCGAPNLSFLASLHVSTSRLPQPAPHADLDRSKVHCHY